ncbi:amino acid permease-domain-containing protein [Ilyonectria robusta]|uniref:amino acid permease-domain-containing protein n=1 Tax=Ilyonectria robusta TaxID=1079257 RepID=UPI001E8ECEE5|nr:amino acid permease-domain-containing protein [Ilyonectria robusta]KAH8733756.1 amino acid permease-domain-containing protein [Ilyonectria robusta]
MTKPQPLDGKGGDGRGGRGGRPDGGHDDAGSGDRRPSAAMSEQRDSTKLGTLSGVYIPVFLNIMSILMFLRFGLILGQVGFMGIFGLLIIAYCIDLLTTLSLSAIASNGEVKGGGAYYLISRSLGPEFGGSIGILFFLAQVLNASMNVVGLIDCIRLNMGPAFPEGYWTSYGLQTAALILCTGLCFLGSATFSKASNALLAVLSLAIISIPISAIFKEPFRDETLGIDFTGPSFNTLADNFLPHTTSPAYNGLATFRDLFGILFPATSGIFAGASMSGDLKDPSRSIPNGTLWAMLTTFIAYFVVILSLAASTTHASFLANPNAISLVSLSQPVILAGECAVTFFSALMGLIGSAKLFQAFARDKLLPGLSIFGRGTKHGDEPIFALLLTYAIAQVALLADLNQIATFISMGYQMTFFVMNLACFLLKIGSAPNFRPSFKFFAWQTALLAGLLSAAAMFFIDETYAAIAVSVLVLLFLLIHYLSPPKRWGDVSQNLIYHQVRKYLLRLRPEHIKFWRPHIILLINNPRRQTRLIQFCNSLKKGSLYILGHVIVTDDFDSGVHEARLQQHAWTNYISEFSRIKAFVQLTMSPTINWGIRNLILSAGLGGMRPNIAVLGFYNMDELRKSNLKFRVPDVPVSPTVQMRRPPKSEGKAPRRRGDTSARLLEGILPTDVIRTEEMMSPTQYLTILEDLALKCKLNVAVGCGFDKLETPRKDGTNHKKYIDLWPIQMSAEVAADGKNLLTTNFDTYTLILQLGHILHSVHAWRQAYSLRVMVFVEYENEVQEEHARVMALLEKLRIDAEVKVFCLASGDLNTYELIIHGISRDIDWEIVVNDTLKEEEWWDDLQMFRGQPENMTSAQEANHLAHIFDSTSGRPGIYNPHEENYDRRRASVVDVLEMPRKPPIGVLSKMGVNMGIHTHHLHDDALDDLTTDDESEIEGASSADSDEERAYGFEALVDDDDVGPNESVKRPLLGSSGRRKNGGLGERAAVSFWGHHGRGHSPNTGGVASATSYGTLSASRTRRSNGLGMLSDQNLVSRSITEADASTPNDGLEVFPSLGPPEARGSANRSSRSRQMSPTREDTVRPLRDGISTPGKPNLSRQSSAVRFTSRPVPETKITTEAEGSKISFAPSDFISETPRVDRPAFSRQSSLGKFSSRPTPETRVTVGEEEGRTITFAEQPIHHPRSAGQSRHHSRQNSQATNFSQGDVRLPMPEMLERYTLDPRVEDGDESATPYSGQGVELSFNELPSRAQHLILNELMRRYSKDTAVLLSTLPIPSEGTSLDEAATIRYLSDVEVLCNEMPPTLMVLSNNMTVTVSL